MGVHLSTSTLPPTARDKARRTVQSGGISLDLTRHGLTALPSRLQLRSILYLHLPHNALDTLPATFASRWTQLVLLDLSFNACVQIPIVLAALPRLQTLLARGNSITSLSIASSAGNPSAGNSLNVRTFFPALQQLDLSGNLLTAISEDVWKITNLRELLLDFNMIQIVQYPQTSQSLVDLSVLRLAKNGLRQFLVPLASLAPNLRVLDLSTNAISDLGAFPHLDAEQETIHGCYYPASLQVLCLFENSLTGIPEFHPAMTALSVANLCRNQIHSIPASIGFLVGLRELNISTNDVAEIPHEFSLLKSLQYLDLSKNRISSLPEHLAALSSLTKLIATKNSITNFPAALYALPLQQLNLSSNRLVHIPTLSTQQPQIAGHLLELYLSFNEIDDVPAFIFSCSKLQALGLAYNKLSSLSVECTKLTELKYFFLSGNVITSVPFDLKDIAQLKWLYLNNNSMRNIPQNINDYNCDIKDLSSNRLVVVHAGNSSPREDPNAGRRRSNCFRGAATRQSRRFKVSHAEMIGRRPHMEDATCLRGFFRNRTNEDFFAVFDGHGTDGNGKKAADYLTMYLPEDLENALTEAFKPYTSKGIAVSHATSSSGAQQTADQGGKEHDAAAFALLSRSVAGAEAREARGVSSRRNLQSLSVTVGEAGAPVVQEDDDIVIERDKEISLVTQVITSTFEKNQRNLARANKKDWGYAWFDCSSRVHQEKHDICCQLW
eukprot:TRINITY_DN7935_c0_g1_i4.p1 TRINITY_DN7935_c0_g1~~TRINITY_DN7935_c0_g1_i4.p1  ORF type:complete len:722 (+),score=147.03 TRINITY_DN7935_c0_g1_i4:86-2251(+)